ncbi:MAG: nuclear transport factor 2 family protein [Acetobacteraceae bacterium]|nr:nuclear transport factor 2 family protein [Acetobacteraceae bacterium]
MKKVLPVLTAAFLVAFVGHTYAADAGMIALQDIASKWSAAYNSGDAKKLAELYSPNAIFLSGTLGALRGRTEIENAIAGLVKRAPKIMLNPVEAHENENVVWGYWDYAIPNGPTGYGGVTAVKEGEGWLINLHVSNVKPKKE